MTKPVAPTPTPWEIVARGSDLNPAHVIGAGNSLLVLGGDDAANAELIVRAVNSHQALVEVVRRLIQMHDEQDWPIENDLTLLENARNALALAEDRSQ